VSTLAHLTLADYDRMIEAGVLGRGPNRRVELIYGDIRPMTPIGSRHLVVVARLNEWSFESLPRAKAWVWVQGSIELPTSESVPEPDLVWVARRDYSQSRPTAADVLLLIEVADTSLGYDRGEKADLYAAAGIPDYWLVDLTTRMVEVRREPWAGRYHSLQTYAGDAEIHPLCLPEVVLRPSKLWAPD
jgi:Uma2 family endonuclease